MSELPDQAFLGWEFRRFAIGLRVTPCTSQASALPGHQAAGEARTGPGNARSPESHRCHRASKCFCFCHQVATLSHLKLTISRLPFFLMASMCLLLSRCSFKEARGLPSTGPLHCGTGKEGTACIASHSVHNSCTNYESTSTSS